MRITEMSPTELKKLKANAIPLRGTKATEAQIAAKAEEFEAVFLGQMLQHMFSGVETDPLFGGGHGEDVYRSFMVDEYAKIVAKTGGIGVADHVKAEMLRMQEVGAPQPMMPKPGMVNPSQMATPMLAGIEG